MKEGVAFVTTGPESISEAQRAARRIKELDLGYPIAILADQRPEIGIFDEYIPIEDPEYHVSDKHRNIHRSPFDRTIYMDADTYIVDRDALDELFELLDKFDLVGTLDTGRRWELYGDDTPPVRAPVAFPQLNSGVLCFERTDAVEELFDLWRAVYNRLTENSREGEHVPDQAALREALYRSDVSYGTVGPEYNCRIPFVQQLNGKVKILHGRPSNIEEVAREVNTETDGRTVIPLHRSGKWYTADHHRVVPVVVPWTRPDRFFPFFREWWSEDGFLRAVSYVIGGGPTDGPKRFEHLEETFSEDGAVEALISIKEYIGREYLGGVGSSNESDNA